jgi:acetolactate synthase I/II/III large subunit
MKLTDYVIDFLAAKGVRHVFGLTGGAVVHIFDSAYASSALTPVFHHHEQAASFAAQAYARVSEGIGACCVTTGPGATNALTGLTAAWLDSVPCVYISGQARLAHTTRGTTKRQIGTQQLDIIRLVEPLTNYAVMIDDPQTIRFHLEKAYFLATSGRPGPVWIDIPLDLQWAQVDPERLERFDPPASRASRPEPGVIDQIVGYLEQSERPLILAGYGVRRAHAIDALRELVDRCELPFATTWGAVDVLPTAHPRHVGRPGIAGQRGANLAVQNCDLLIALGSHLCIPVTGTILKSFARAATVVVVDIDRVELDECTVPVDVAVQCDAKVFLQDLLTVLPPTASYGSERWRRLCSKYRTYNTASLTGQPSARLNPYAVVQAVSEHSTGTDVMVVDGGGTNVYVCFQTIEAKPGQRVILSTGLCAMGSGLPESIGACLAADRRRTICFCGDGSFQLNVQELETIRHHRLPIKVFVSNNGGYLSIRHTQHAFLKGRLAGSAPEGELSLPDVLAVARAYGIRTCRIETAAELQAGISCALAGDDPVVCEVLTLVDQEQVPRQGFDALPDGTFAPRPLEDMAPYLDRAEFLENMVIAPWTPPR